MAVPSPDPRALRPAPIHRLTTPVRRFLEIEAASGAVLLLCAVAALLVANSPLGHAFHGFWQTPLRVGVGGWELNKSLEWWTNDGLMTVFFFVVGLEIKRELVTGELRTLRKAALPVVAAVGGMLVPAGVYALFGHTGAAARGWGIPMATDIAFVVGVMAAFGRRVPFGLKIFLLSLAIADDMGAVLVIALAYTDQLDLLMLALAGGGFALTVALNLLGVRPVPVYVLVGAATWLAVYKSGIHPTVAGVLLGLLTPYRAWLGKDTLRLALDDVAGRLNDRPEQAEMTPADVTLLRYAAREAVAPLQRLEDRLHPWVGFVIMPVFALANAGVAVKLAAVTDPVALAVAAGLVVGKPVGIVLFSWVAVRLRLAALPTGVTWRMTLAAGFLGGIGFTMSLFVGGLAFPESPELLADAKTGILLGSGVAAVLGAAVLAASLKSGKADGAPA
jgi:NhaA family Na+:H+ antiporter